MLWANLLPATFFKSSIFLGVGIFTISWAITTSGAPFSKISLSLSSTTDLLPPELSVETTSELF